ncbi:hypothetical protein EC844_10152 [Acinetobacter calcoaceticus]|uniref:CHAP domain-containing protein n=1 Tax=Acinetobacter calcoaceticus TaxID=471 RepID=A0A4R1YA47_ACICA|nr:hypothetical protein EC844_10152 [Acinetobacter calcoaceticus]
MAYHPPVEHQVQKVEQHRAQSQVKKGSKASGQRININQFTQVLSNIKARKSSKKCAASIRVALQSAGARIVKHPVAAADWGPTLKDIGYRKINPSFEQPKPGDIYIIQRTGSHVYGHIAGFTGKEWVSDFKQTGHAVYKGKVNYEYFRLGS